MTRSDVLLDELSQFRVDEEGVFDELSIKNARIVLLAILGNSNSFSTGKFPQNVANFIMDTVKAFMILPNSEIEIIREASQIGLALSEKLPQGPELKTFINNLI